jgi:casein kinase II subunit beta
MQPAKSQRRYEPRVFGFRMHAAAALSRWQSEQREGMKERLRTARVETGFEEEDEELEDEEDDDEEMDGGNGFEGTALPAQ